MFMHAENLGHHEHDRRLRLAFGPGAVGDHLAIPDRHLDLAGQQTGGISTDRRLRHHRLHGSGKTRAQAGHEKSPAVEGLRRNKTVELGLGLHVVVSIV